MASRRALPCVALLAGVAFAVPAAAEGEVGDIALNQFDPAPAGDPLLGVPSPFIGGHLVPRARVLADFASEPLVLTTETPSGSTSGTIVGYQSYLHIGTSLSLLDGLLADLSLPIAVAQGGDSPVLKDAPFTSPTSAAVGDLRFGVRVRVLGEDQDPFQLAGAAALYFPTGAEGSYVGDGAFREAPAVLLGGRLSYFVWSAMVGAMIRGSDNPTSLLYGGGAALVLLDGMIQVGPEVFAATPLQESYLRPRNIRSIPRERLTNAEVMLSTRLRVPFGFHLVAGGGVGLSDAIGTPAFRLVAGIGWELPEPETAELRDTDADSIPDETDACPYAFGSKSADPKTSGCPPPQENEAAPPPVSPAPSPAGAAQP